MTERKGLRFTTALVIGQIFSSVPPGCFLLFNIFLCDLFLFLLNTETASYVDDKTPYAVNKSINEVVRDIKMASEWLFTWFQYKTMKANPDKFHLLLADTDCQLTQKNLFVKNC